MNKILKKLTGKLSLLPNEKATSVAGRYLTDSGVSAIFSETREMAYLSSRDIEKVSSTQRGGNFGSGEASREMKTLKINK
jgi:hypothetical protein